MIQHLLKPTDCLFCHLNELLENVIQQKIIEIPKVEIKYFNVLIDGKRFFDLPVKNEEETYEKIIEINRNNDYTTSHLLDFAYF